MSIIRISHDKTNPYVMLNKKALEDPDLSWGAKGLWSYLMSRPDNWQVSVSHLCKIYTGRGGRKDAIYSLLNELIESGYCETSQLHAKNGKFEKREYNILEIKKCLPNRDSTDSENSNSVKCDTNNKRSLKKKEERTNVEALEFSREEAKQLDEESSFVRSFSSVEEEIIELLTPLGLNENQISSFFKYTLNEIKSAIIVLKKSSKKINNIPGFLNDAILKKWGPTSTKLDKEREFQKEKERINSRIIENRNKCNELYLKWVDSFTKSFNFKVSDNSVIIKVGNGLTPLNLNHPSAVNYLEIYIEEYLATHLPNHNIIYSQGEGIHLGYLLERKEDDR